jgi:hypothetical protein
LPDAGEHRDRFLPHRARVAGVDPLAELLVGIGASGAELEAAVRQLVEHGGALGDVDRMVSRQDAHAEPDPDPPGQLTEGAEQDLGARRAREPGEEVMLHEPEVVEPDLLGEHALLDRLLVERVPVDARARERSLRFVEQAESHGRSPWTDDRETAPILARRLWT